MTSTAESESTTTGSEVSSDEPEPQADSAVAAAVVTPAAADALKKPLLVSLGRRMAGCTCG